MNRDCPICFSNFKNTAVLYKNKMSVYDQKINLSYDVVACQKCGMLYANNLPNDNIYFKYYGKYSKYDTLYRHNEIYDDVLVDDINTFFDKKSLIFDIGCSVGMLLNKLKKSGFNNLNGIEPSPNAKKLIKKNFSIDIISGFFGKKEIKNIEKIDCFIIASVLEHIKNLDDFLRPLKNAKIGSIVYVVVPNVDFFHSQNNREIFYEFSCEHINYFNDSSLNNLMSKYGYTILRYDNQLQPTGSYNLIGKFIKQDYQTFIGKSSTSLDSIQKYIAINNNLLESKLKMFSEHDSIIIYGAGSHTLRFLPYIKNVTNVKYIVDDNPNLIGKYIDNFKIKRLKEIKNNKKIPIFLSTSIYLDEMKKFLKMNNVTNKLITFY